jgi:hypothetical protein
VLRHAPPAVDGLLLCGGGPPRFAERLRQIEVLTARHERLLGEERRRLQAQFGDGELLTAAVRRLARGWDLEDVNRLIDDHNRWYPIERRLPVDPASGDYLPVLGRSYRRPRLNAAWALERLLDGRSEPAPAPATARRVDESRRRRHHALALERFA